MPEPDTRRGRRRPRRVRHRALSRHRIPWSRSGFARHDGRGAARSGCREARRRRVGTRRAVVVVILAHGIDRGEPAADIDPYRATDQPFGLVGYRPQVEHRAPRPDQAAGALARPLTGLRAPG
ncbi:TetR/AcrR family transcriptional regulator C-terminal ligand-binding domain-containing protein [Nocardia sp. NPDC087230]|uniref:TetR/AcrR family transcriptional regulator C-terminal ligand-binding domain-containing protein n=1 Tax=Nocardia sp. NPDC087230 TaxID=3364331 RepID=UPI00382B51D5